MGNETTNTELRTGDELPATQVQAGGGLPQEGATDAAEREAIERAPHAPVKTSADVAAAAGDFAPGSAANALPAESGANGGAFNEERAVLEERANIGINDPDGKPPSTPYPGQYGTEPASGDLGDGAPAAGAVADAPEAGEGRVRSAKPLGGTMEAGRAAEEAAAAFSGTDAGSVAGNQSNLDLASPGHHVGSQVEMDESRESGLHPVGVDSRGRVWRIEHKRGKVLATMVGRLLT